MRPVILAALSLTLLAAPAAAQNSSHSSSTASSVNLHERRDVARRAPVIAKAEAGAIALKRVPGKLLGAELETNDGIRTWQVDVQARDGHHVRMWLNAGNGAFLKMAER